MKNEDFNAFGFGLILCCIFSSSWYPSVAIYGYLFLGVFILAGIFCAAEWIDADLPLPRRWAFVILFWPLMVLIPPFKRWIYKGAISCVEKEGSCG